MDYLETVVTLGTQDTERRHTKQKNATHKKDQRRGTSLPNRMYIVVLETGYPAPISY